MANEHFNAVKMYCYYDGFIINYTYRPIKIWDVCQTYLSGLGSLGSLLHELVVDAVLDHEPGAGAAALALVEEQGKVSHLHSLE